MPVYVDQLQKHGKKNWCHMIGDSIRELHFIADQIGMKREWYQESPPASFPHYDLQESKRRQAIEHGAIEVDRFTFVRKMRELDVTKGFGIKARVRIAKSIAGWCYTDSLVQVDEKELLAVLDTCFKEADCLPTEEEIQTLICGEVTESAPLNEKWPALDVFLNKYW